LTCGKHAKLVVLLLLRGGVFTPFFAGSLHRLFCWTIKSLTGKDHLPQTRYFAARQYTWTDATCRRLEAGLAAVDLGFSRCSPSAVGSA
jgi:hypothetical protein